MQPGQPFAHSVQLRFAGAVVDVFNNDFSGRRRRRCRCRRMHATLIRLNLIPNVNCNLNEWEPNRQCNVADGIPANPLANLLKNTNKNIRWRTHEELQHIIKSLKNMVVCGHKMCAATRKKMMAFWATFTVFLCVSAVDSVLNVDHVVGFLVTVTSTYAAWHYDVRFRSRPHTHCDIMHSRNHTRERKKNNEHADMRLQKPQTTILPFYVVYTFFTIERVIACETSCHNVWTENVERERTERCVHKNILWKLVQ